MRWGCFSATILHSSPVPSTSAGLSGELKLHAHVAAVRLNEAVQSRASLDSSTPSSHLLPSHIPLPLIFSSEETGGGPVSTLTWHLTIQSELVGGRDNWHFIFSLLLLWCQWKAQLEAQFSLPLEDML